MKELSFEYHNGEYKMSVSVSPTGFLAVQMRQGDIYVPHHLNREEALKLLSFIERYIHSAEEAA